MHERSSAGAGAGDRRLERAIVLALLGEDGARRSSRTQLALALGAEAEAFAKALARLSDTGVVCLAGEEVWASPGARHIDELGLIGI